MAALLQRLPCYCLACTPASILTHRADVAVVLAALFLFGVTETFGSGLCPPSSRAASAVST
jgi:hypothetical protein